MAGARTIPANFPQPLGYQIAKAETLRQASMVRQELATDLISILRDIREPQVRQRVVRLIENQLRAGRAAAEKARALWPELNRLEEILAGKPDLKPTVAKKHLKVYEQFDRVHRRSLALLDESFEHIRVILDRLQPPEQVD